MKTMLLLSALTVSVLLTTASAVADEPVAHLTGCARMFEGVLLVNATGCFTSGVPLSQVDDRLKKEIFRVYTVAEVDDRLASITKRVDTQLKANQELLGADLVKSIDSIPQRILADTAAQAIKDAVLLQIREDMAQMRKDLEAEIGALQPAKQ